MMAHAERIERNRDTLLRCANINVLIVARLRAVSVIDGAQESRLEAEKAHHDKLCLLIDWIKKGPDRIYESFLNVMEENEQQHVSNLLRGNEDDNHVPLSLARYDRLLRIRPDLMFMIHNDATLIAELISSNAISKTDAEELAVEKKSNHRRNNFLINAILRRSDYSFECLNTALRNTHHADAADFIEEGEVFPVHVNTPQPDLDETLSKSINDGIMIESADETAPKEIQVPQLNGLRIVGATPGHSIVILVYCKTIANMVTFTQLFKSGKLQTTFQDILNRLFKRIEPQNKKRLKVRIRMDDKDIFALEEITGIEDWMEENDEKIKTSRIGHPFVSRNVTEIEKVTSTESLSTESKGVSDGHLLAKCFFPSDQEDEEISHGRKGRWIHSRKRHLFGPASPGRSNKKIRQSAELKTREWMVLPPLETAAHSNPAPRSKRLSLSPSDHNYMYSDFPESIVYKMSHGDAIARNYDVLLRCTTINDYVIDFLKAENVLNRMQEAELRTQRNPLIQCILLFQWLKEVSSDRYHSFLLVMNDTEQEHVANLLIGNTEVDYLPLSDARHARLAKIGIN